MARIARAASHVVASRVLGATRVRAPVLALALPLALALASAGSAFAQGQEPTPTPIQPTLSPPAATFVLPAAQPARPASPAGQGIAVLAVGPARDEAFALARAIYGSRLRPTSLDEVRARVLAGAAPPPNASRELRELAEVRAGIMTEDAAGRRLLTGLAQQVGAQALLVVKVERAAAPSAPAGPPPPASDAGADLGVDAGASAGSPTGNAPPATTVIARLFLTDSGDFDAARYAPDPGLEGPAAWKSTVMSLEARFPLASRAVGASSATALAPVKITPEDEKSSPFYTSGWFWGAVAGAALLGGAFYFATRDTGADPIHLQLKVPR
jgi:hypothetical protein